MLAVKVPLKEAEKVKQELIDKNLMLRSCKIASDKDFVYFPVKEKLGDYEFVDCEFDTANKSTKLKAILQNELSEEELKLVKKSFDAIGTIAIIEVPAELKSKEDVIAKSVMKVNRNIKTVLVKDDVHKGDFRTRKLRYLTGENTKETIYKENNVRIKLNVEEVYFSPRLSNERKRIAKLVKDEDVLVMFSGCGPYPLVISKNAKRVVGVELNPVAHEYAVHNAMANKFTNIELYNGDVRVIVQKLGKFDRILMPLPKTGEEFLDVALGAAKKGTVIHFYDFSNEDEFPELSINKIKSACEKAELKFKVLNSVKCGAYCPRVYRVCVDFMIF